MATNMTTELTFDISKLTTEERLIRERDIDSLFEGLKETKLNLDHQECAKLYDYMQQGAVDNGHSRWEFYKQN
jgi:hypothetical protein